MEDAIIGRHAEREVLRDLLESSRPELLALYGRRRVGKTFLINEFFEDSGVLLEVVGTVDSSPEVQLARYAVELANTFPGIPKDTVFPTWDRALMALVEAVDGVMEHRAGQKITLFFDEAPWLDAGKSGFLPALAYVWNKHFSRRKYGDLVVVVCGSAASWIIDRVVDSKGGLHNRVTETMRLAPFDLAETRQYLEARGVRLEPMHLLEVYMALGGVAAYLGNVKPGMSSAQIINQLCFTGGRYMTEEFGRLFSSLFAKHHNHVKIVRALASAPRGLTRDGILQKTGMSNGGETTRFLRELEESGFIALIPSYRQKKKGRFYRLVDEYSLFYLRWMEPARVDALGTLDEHYWQRQCQRASWLAWAGYAFEGICLKNVDRIKHALGISGVQTTQSSWSHSPGPGEEGPGAQIDLVIDRADRSINLCEIKFVRDELEISARLRRDLERKKEVFRTRTRTRSLLLTTLITSYGVKKGKNYRGIVDNQLTMDCLF